MGKNAKTPTTFPVLMSGRDREAYPDAPRFVRWELVAPFEERAKRNHGGQTLRQLAARGGLSPYELVAVLTDKPLDASLGWTDEQLLQSEGQAVRQLLAIMRKAG